MPKPTSEREIFTALATRFASPDYVLLPQVRNGTGFSKQARTADALAISTFPSRGIYAHGCEIKVTRADWRKELAEAAKADAIAKHCQYWSVVAPKGVVPVDELPLPWGLIEVEDGATKIVKHAKILDEAAAPDWSFTAAVFRAYKAHVTPEDDVAKKVSAAKWAGAQEERERHRATESRERDRHSREYDLLSQRVREFEAFAGFDIGSRYGNPETIGKAVQMVLRLGLCDQDGDRDCLRRLATRLSEVESYINDFTAQFDPAEAASP